MPQPRLSIILPTYNRAASLRRALDALLRQAAIPSRTRSSSSTTTARDGTRDDGAGDGRCRASALLSEPRQGLSYARNAGLDAARGFDRRVHRRRRRGRARLGGDDRLVARRATRRGRRRRPGPARVGVRPAAALADARALGAAGAAGSRRHPKRIFDRHHPIGLIGANVAFRREVFDRIGPVFAGSAASEERDRIDRRSRAAHAPLRRRRADALSAADAGARARAARALRSRLPPPLARGSRAFLRA